MIQARYSFGAELQPGAGVRFRLYAPAAKTVTVVFAHGASPARTALHATGGGVFEATVAAARPGTRYAFEIDGCAPAVPDPASRYQPDGVHAPSEIVDPNGFAWPDDGWRGRPWNEIAIYELHVGAFTPAGTYLAAIEKLDDLVDLGVTAIELMPLAQPAGRWNWGYDGTLPYAPAAAYGRPEDLKRLVAAAHARGLAVMLDVVYNHFGPEGNYLGLSAPSFFTDRVQTPWGPAIDFAAPGNAPVRAFFIENALYWLRDFRFDGLRLDAIHEIVDPSAKPVLVELAETVAAEIDRPVFLTIEDDRNEGTLLGAGYTAQWNDDLHHAFHVILTGESDGYYGDFVDRPIELLGRALTSGYAYQGENSAFRDGQARGVPSAPYPLGKFIGFLQNHDQIGNRVRGERITQLASREAVRAAVAILLLAPSPPLLFMGQEWGASTPFLFFCDFEPGLARAVRVGRRREFAAFARAAPVRTIPDPTAPESFEHSKLRWDERGDPAHRAWLDEHRQLLGPRMREIVPRIAGVRGADAGFACIGERGLCARWRLDDGTTLALAANLGSRPLERLAARATGRLLFATHDAGADGIAEPWSVRWTLE